MFAIEKHIIDTYFYPTGLPLSIRVVSKPLPILIWISLNIVDGSPDQGFSLAAFRIYILFTLQSLINIGMEEKAAAKAAAAATYRPPPKPLTAAEEAEEANIMASWMKAAIPVKSANDLFTAASNGDLAAVTLLIAGGANVNVENIHKNTPLHLAAGNGHKDIVEELLRNGADASKINLAGQTAAKIASDNGHNEIVELLKGFKGGSRRRKGKSRSKSKSKRRSTRRVHRH
jgi:hypothetical protein